MAENDNAVNNVETAERGFFGKLSNGDFGLIKTYWLCGVLTGFIANVIMSSISSNGLLAIMVLLCAAYQAPLTMGMWRAANKYKGFVLWAVLAKISAVLGAIMVSFGALMALIGLLT